LVTPRRIELLLPG